MGKLTIIPTTTNYQRISKQILCDVSLDCRTVGVYARLAVLGGIEISFEELADALGISVKLLRSSFTLLEERGYLNRSVKRDAKGRCIGWDWEICPCKKLENNRELKQRTENQNIATIPSLPKEERRKNRDISKYEVQISDNQEDELSAVFAKNRKTEKQQRRLANLVNSEECKQVSENQQLITTPSLPKEERRCISNYRNNIINNNIYSHTSLITRTREDDLNFELLNTASFWECVEKRYKITKDDAVQIFEDFKLECFAKAKEHSSLKDLRTHFFDWIRYQQTNKQNEKRNNNYNQDRRRGTEVNATRAEDYKTSF